VHVEPLSGVGYSNSSHHRVEAVSYKGGPIRFVLKRTRLGDDWMARRTADRLGREAHILGEARLRSVWDIFRCPYVAFAVETAETGLLLWDLTAGLFPDARVPLSEREERTLLGALARMHARFWNLDTSSLDWLVRPAQYCDLLGPSVVEDPDVLAALSSTLREAVPRGWASALTRLPAESRRHLVRPGDEFEREWADVPKTLLHGDVKVANFAMLGDGGVSVFDWAIAGAGPCAVDVGWYLAVNASRLTASKEEILRRYRLLLEASLGRQLPADDWNRLEDIAVIAGARMLLWSKALALDSGRPGAAEEWQWWDERIAAAARNAG
jgi:hypothetical protein